MTIDHDKAVGGWHEHDHDVFVGCEQFPPAWLHA